MAVLLETTLGDLVVDLFIKERPNCSLNFIKLCKMKYYNLCQFHHIEQNYIAQTGDPTGTGRGGESVFSLMYGEQARYFEKEEVPKLRHKRTGLLSFVNNGHGMLGSQFFITLADDLDYLDEDHTIFGQVTEGLETIERLKEQLCDDDHKPFKDIRICHTIILDDPFGDPKMLRPPSRSPSPTLERLTVSGQINLDEREDENDGKTEEELKREADEKEMRAQAQLLEIVGDLRHADDVPPENVLFVCKLNPVTTDEDLEIIFSRFGKIICCEIIRDRRTGDSLQYAFIEFDNPKSVEAAYMKMDNVLIDDRRIHVDFSQSVSKQFKWKKGQGGRADEFDAQGRTKGERADVGRRNQNIRGVKNEPMERDNRRPRNERERGRDVHERSPKRRRSRSPEDRRREKMRDRSPQVKRERGRDRKEKRKERDDSREAKRERRVERADSGERRKERKRDHLREKKEERRERSRERERERRRH